MIEYKLSYFKENGKWYSDSSIGLDEGLPWHEAIDFITQLSRAGSLPGLIQNHSPFIVLVHGKDVVPHLILTDAAKYLMRGESNA